MTAPREPVQRQRRLTREDVIEMRGRYARGDGSVRQLAREYGVTRSTAHRAIRRQSYRHIRRGKAEVEAERIASAHARSRRVDKARAAGYDQAVSADATQDEVDRPIATGTGRIQQLVDGVVVATFAAVGRASAATGVPREDIAGECNGKAESWRYEPGAAPPVAMPLFGESAQLSDLRGWHVVGPGPRRDGDKG
jgi:transposase-like protein